MKKNAFSIPFQYFKYSGLILLCIFVFIHLFGINLIQILFGDIQNIYMQVMIYGFLFFMAMICFRKVFALSFRHLKDRIVKADTLAYCFMVSFFGNALSSIVIAQLTRTANANEQGLNELIEPGVAIGFFIFSVILGPVVEELVFRGYLFRLFRQKTYWIAHLLVAILFGFYHNWSEILIQHDFLQLLFILPYGFVSIGFTMAYEKTDNICYPIILHSLMNFVAFVYTFIL